MIPDALSPSNRYRYRFFVFLALLRFMHFHIAVGQCFHKCHDIGFFFLCQSEVSQFLLVHGGRILGRRKFITHIPHVIEMYNLLECLKIAIMTIRSRQFDISQRGYTELAIFAFGIHNGSQSQINRIRS